LEARRQTIFILLGAGENPCPPFARRRRRPQLAGSIALEELEGGTKCGALSVNLLGLSVAFPRTVAALSLNAPFVSGADFLRTASGNAIPLSRAARHPCVLTRG